MLTAQNDNENTLVPFQLQRILLKKGAILCK